MFFYILVKYVRADVVGLESKINPIVVDFPQPLSQANHKLGFLLNLN